jgi:hypothetical protein
MGRTATLVLLCLCALLIAPAAAFDVTFTVIDGTESYVDIQFKGSMNGWANVPMDDTDGDHTWTLTLDVPAGIHEWGVIENDGSASGIWLIDGADRQVEVDDGGYVTGQTSYEIPVPAPTVDVTFLVDMNAEEVGGGVYVAGSFQGWDWTGTPMLDPDGDSFYTVTVAIEENTSHIYKFYNPPYWENVPAACGVDDGYGGFLRVLTVPAAGTGDHIEAHVFGSCDIPVANEAVTLSHIKALFR